MTLAVHQFPCLEDNYGFLLHDAASGETACIDTPDPQAYLREAAARGWRISHIWNTHWHPDHAGGNEAIKAETGCIVIAPVGDAGKIAGVDRVVDQGDTVALGAATAQVINVGGHTLGHIAYYLPGDAGPDAGPIAFVGDALFALGCGRMFEGTAAQFWASLARLKALPPATTLYCAHEYTAGNARFALSADPENAALAAYATEIATRRAAGRPTVPFGLARELATNPFLRADTPALQARWGAKDTGAGMGADDAVATFAALRAAKDDFRG